MVIWKSWRSFCLFQSINRTLLHWLKLWDYVVFGKDVKLKKKEMSKKGKEKEPKKKKFLPEVIDELDKHNRPVQKVCIFFFHLSLYLKKNSDYALYLKSVNILSVIIFCKKKKCYMQFNIVLNHFWNEVNTFD